MALKALGTFGGFFGNGSDGDVKVTGTLNLTRDMNYHVLVLSGTAAGPPTIFMNSFRINVRDKLIFLTSGTIDCSGGSGSIGGGAGVPASGGLAPRPSAFVSGSLPSFGDGGSGSLPNVYGGATGSGGWASFGGNGGNGGSPAANRPGGPGGVLTSPSGSSGSLHNPFFAMLGCTFGPGGPYFMAGGAGGGGGGSSSATNSGSGGGGGGGVAVIAARQIIVGLSGTYTEAASLTPGFPFSGTVAPFSGTVFTRVVNQTGTISAHGGVGAAGSGINTGAGGGGGGGVICLVTSAHPRLTGVFGSVDSSFFGLSASLLIDSRLQSGTLLLDVGGAAGGAAGGGTAGAGGLYGTVFYIDV